MSHPQPRRLVCALLFSLAAAGPASATPLEATVVLTLPEALELATRQAFSVRGADLSREDARAQVRGAFASVLPQLSGSATYTRTIEALDPFAGSDAGSAFAGLDAVQWLQLNEGARTDGDPATNPITLGEFQSRSAAALIAAGVDVSGEGNPFLVENGFRFGLSLSQIIYDASAFAALDGARAFETAAQESLAATRLSAVQAASRAFYGALLQKAQLEVIRQSVARAQANVADVRVRVKAGVLPELQLLTAEVELANRETDSLQAEVELRNVLDDLRELVALPPHQRIEVRGELVYEARAVPGESEAAALAFSKRPDLAEAQALAKVSEVAEGSAVGGLFPRLSLNANLSANGAVPDDRSVVRAAPTAADPFAVTRDELGFFDNAYWFPVFDVGLRLEWNLFDGFGSYARIDQSRIATRRARLAVAQVELQIRIEVERSLRALRFAAAQVETQERVESLAQRNYAQTETELREGAATQFDLRQANQQLDESRFNRLRAIHDHAVAWVDYQVAVGTPPSPQK